MKPVRLIASISLEKRQESFSFRLQKALRSRIKRIAYVLNCSEGDVVNAILKFAIPYVECDNGELVVEYNENGEPKAKRRKKKKFIRDRRNELK